LQVFFTIKSTGSKHSKGVFPMAGGTTGAHDAIRDKRATDVKSQIGNWEIHSWGNGKFSGMAVVSAITALQIGATLSPVSADQIALNKAAEYLLETLAPQVRSFWQALAAD
jgi:hypothetical protein